MRGVTMGYLTRWLGPAAIAFSLFLAGVVLVWAESYNKGQPVWPAYEGWEKNADGSFNLVFGYMNDNWEEQLDLPVGPGNNIEPGGPDQGQPTHFLPRRNRFMFRIRVPKDFGSQEVVWTLIANKKTTKAYASLRPDLVIENVDIMSETGALGAGTSSPEIRANKPPFVKLEGEKTRGAKVGQPVELVAIVTDDGVPKARKISAQTARNSAFRPLQRITVTKVLGLHLSWFVYRGRGGVSFEPSQIKVWEDTRAGANSPWAPVWVLPPVPADGRYVTEVKFDEPGTYVLCARADDGGLTTDEMLTFNVTQ
jgi:hypothetical protein